MATFIKYLSGVYALNTTVNLNSDSFKIGLTNAANQFDTTYTSAYDTLSAANGYTAGGNAVSLSSLLVTTSGSSPSATSTLTWTTTNPTTWTATAGGIGPFRYAFLYDTTITGNTITAATTSGSVITVTTALPHGLAAGSNIVVTGSSGIAALIGSFSVTSITSSTVFTITVASSGTYTSGATLSPVNLIAYWDYGSSITLNSADTFAATFSTGVLTLN
jgi:hypothetical protein